MIGSSENMCGNSLQRCKIIFHTLYVLHNHSRKDTETTIRIQGNCSAVVCADSSMPLQSAGGFISFQDKLYFIFCRISLKIVKVLSFDDILYSEKEVMPDE